MNLFVQELSVLLRLDIPEGLKDNEEFTKLKIKQEISALYLNQKNMKRKIDEIERKKLLY